MSQSTSSRTPPTSFQLDRARAGALPSARVPVTASPRVRATTASLPLVLAALVLACRPKASYVRTGQDAYNLVTTAPSVEQAVVRIRRTADELCPEKNYRVSDPRILDREWDVGILGMSGPRVTVQAYLSCSAQPPLAAEPPVSGPPAAEPPVTE